MLEFRTLGTLDLRRQDGSRARSLSTAPKRLALLAYLVLARPFGFHRRDSLLALFWPELDDRHARGSLRNLLHMLRRTLGPQVVLSRGDDEVGIARETIWCDAAELDSALAAGKLEEALELYRGDLLDGFHVPDAAPEFEHWLEGERARLREAAIQAASELHDRARSAGDAEGALRWGRWGLARAPSSERALRQVISALDAIGDRGAALAAYEQGAARLEAEYGIDPSAETQALMQSVRARAPAPADSLSAQDRPARNAVLTRGVNRGGPRPAPAPDHVPSIVSGQRDWRRALAARWGVLLILAGMMLGGALAAYAMRDDAGPAGRVTAVGRIQAHGSAASQGMERQLVDMLAGNLSRIPEIQVLSPSRMTELLARVRANGDTTSPVARAARLSDVDELIEGSLHAADDGTMRLDLRRVELQSGQVLDAISVDAPDLPALTERAAAALATSWRLPPPTRNGLTSTRSPLAHGFYEEGLRAYYRGELATARNLLTTALREDSTFAMASYYLAEASAEHTVRLDHFSRALRFAEQAPERDRLTIRAAWDLEFRERSLLARAESLVVRYPLEPTGQYLYGRALIQSGDHASALSYLARVIAMDSSGIDPASPRCRACDALQWTVHAYIYLDSIPAAERTARRWVRMAPYSASAWADLAWTLWRQDRFEEALEARKQAAARRVGNAQDEVYPALVALRAGRFSAADAFLRERITLGRPEVRREALYWLVVSLRYQGRFQEALVVAREYREATSLRFSPVTRENVVAQVLFELGAHESAAEHFGLAATVPLSDQTPGRNASRTVWALVHVASTLAAAHDVEHLGRLADSMAVLGRQSELHRDKLLHYHVRGLLLLAQGRPEVAAEHFRRAIASPSSDYVRPKLELARVLLDLDRPYDAIPILQAALRGPMAGPGFYATRTELHESLGDAWRLAGVADSAAVHYRRVVAAWERADAPVQSRRQEVMRRLTMVGRAGE